MILPATEANIALAAEAIRRGRLVVMPTETVYGLAANALDADAVRLTFATKGRPADNPLIVHLASFASLTSVASAIPWMASVLAERFWPGPLTLVLPKQPSAPSVTTGGLDTVAVRVPAHPVALALITAARVPLSAPSANPFMGVSPTRASDVDPGLAEIVLDGGPCEVGLESTVVDLTGDVPRVLRPGAISAEEISAVLGISVSLAGSAERRSPGLYPRHYAPNAPVRIVDRVAEGDRGIVLGRPAAPDQISLPTNPAAYGAGLYAALHDLDRHSSAPIYVEAPPETAAWVAVWDRLRRAATEAQNRGGGEFGA